MTATQMLEGLGAGIYDTLIPIVVSTMTEGTGRFGIAHGFIVTCWRLGHGLSLLLAESVVQEASYHVAFLTLGGIGVLALLLLVFGVRIPGRRSTFSPDGLTVDGGGGVHAGEIA